MNTTRIRLEQVLDDAIRRLIGARDSIDAIGAEWEAGFCHGVCLALAISSGRDAQHLFDQARLRVGREMATAAG